MSIFKKFASFFSEESTAPSLLDPQVEAKLAKQQANLKGKEAELAAAKKERERLQAIELAGLEAKTKMKQINQALTRTYAALDSEEDLIDSLVERVAASKQETVELADFFQEEGDRMERERRERRLRKLNKPLVPPSAPVTVAPTAPVTVAPTAPVTVAPTVLPTFPVVCPACGTPNPQTSSLCSECSTGLAPANPATAPVVTGTLPTEFNVSKHQPD